MSGLHELIQNTYSSLTQEPGFRLTLEAHYPYFFRAGNYDVHVVDDHKANKYRHDLHGYLNSVNIQVGFHYAVMVMNRMTSVSDFTYDKYKALFVPTETSLRDVISRYRTGRGTAL